MWFWLNIYGNSSKNCIVGTLLTWRINISKISYRSCLLHLREYTTPCSTDCFNTTHIDWSDPTVHWGIYFIAFLQAMKQFKDIIDVTTQVYEVTTKIFNQYSKVALDEPKTPTECVTKPSASALASTSWRFNQWPGLHNTKVQIDIYVNVNMIVNVKVNMWMWHHTHTSEANLRRLLYRFAYQRLSFISLYKATVFTKCWYYVFKTTLNFGIYNCLMLRNWSCYSLFFHTSFNSDDGLDRRD